MSELICPFTNISDTAQSVTIRVLDSSGQLPAPGALITYGNIPPNGSATFGVGQGVATGFLHCEFTVEGDAHATIRASIQVVTAGGNTTAALPAE